MSKYKLKLVNMKMIYYDKFNAKYAYHVVEEDAEGPDGEGSGAVAVAADPFGWGIHAGTCNTFDVI